MKTQFVTPEPYASEALRLAEETKAVSGPRPERFMRIMRENRGSINMFSPFGPSEDGLERKNPIIVALGDSVTAGHFEFNGDPAELFRKVDQGELGVDDAVEITDARECYLEKFRLLLIDKYEQTSVSTINSGIAGDTLYGMQRRLYRDVIRYQPDLLILNGSLNWGPDCGSTEDYRKVLREILCALKNETTADIVLLTSNMDADAPADMVNPHSRLCDRIGVIRALASEMNLILADAYKVWEVYEAAGYPVKMLLANGFNHPSVTGHELYARVLMQMFDDR